MDGYSMSNWAHASCDDSRGMTDRGVHRTSYFFHTEISKEVTIKRRCGRMWVKCSETLQAVVSVSWKMYFASTVGRDETVIRQSICNQELPDATCSNLINVQLNGNRTCSALITRASRPVPPGAPRTRHRRIPLHYMKSSERACLKSVINELKSCE